MKNRLLEFLSRGERVWFGRWHIYSWGYRKEPYKDFHKVWKLLDIKTGIVRDLSDRTHG